MARYSSSLHIGIHSLGACAGSQGTGGGVSVAGHLPSPLQNAVAVTIGHATYVPGGDGTNAVLRILTR